MFKIPLLSMSFLSAVLILMSGCANMGDTNLALTPPVPDPSAAKNGKSVYINMPFDARVFENKPATPEISSISDGNLNVPQNTIIGRTRNGYGKACGNVFLADNNTINKLISDAVKNAFLSKGYAIADSPNCKNTIDVNLKVSRLWGWVTMPKGAGWSYSSEPFRMHAEIKTELELKMPDGKIIKKDVSAASLVTPGLGMTHGNWMKLFDTLISNYSNNFKKEF